MAGPDATGSATSPSEAEVLSTVGRMIANLARSDAFDRGDVASALGQLTEAGAAALRVERSSIWRFDQAQGRLECLDLFERSTARHSAGMSLPASAAPRYFQELYGQRAIAATAARSDPRTREFETNYLIPNGISAMLDAPILLSGELAGVVCHEHTGEPRAWTPWEELVAGMLAHLASMVLGSSDRVRETRVLAEYGSKLEVLIEERTRSLRQEQRFLQTVFASAPFGMAFFDRDCRYLRINDWLAKLNGKPAEETVGRRPSEVIPDPAIAAGAEYMVQSVLASGEPTQPFEASHGNGDDRTFLISAYPIVTDGTVTQVCCLVVDVSAQRKGEEERALLLQRERAAREEAEAASRAKDEFLAMLGHELRNPLAPIQTALHLMEGLGEVAAKERAVMSRQVQHLSRLVDDMLDVARITQGKLELRLAPLDLDAAVSRAIEIASPPLEKGGHFLDVDVPRGGLLVLGDLDRLAQVVSNLLTNAAKFTPAGGRVRIVGSTDGESCRLVVSDTGQGIAPDFMPRLFDAFVQGERALDRSQGGLGLGLAIVHGIMKAHGGDVTAHSDGMGRGSEFTLRFPVFVPPPAGAISRPSPPTPRTARRRCKILVVDDNQDGAEMLASALSTLGHEVAVAFDGPSALALAPEVLPDVALLDLGLPVMDGFELAVKLKLLPDLPTLRLVALTGYGRSRDRERSKAAGFDRHLTKPVDLAALQELLTGLLSPNE